MLKCQLPTWDPLPTRCTFIHFEEDIVERAFLGRAVTCPSTFAPAALVLEQAGRTPAAASATRGRAAPKELVTCSAGHELKRYIGEGNFCDSCGRQHIEAPEHIFRCDPCDFDMCLGCYGQVWVPPQPAWEAKAITPEKVAAPAVLREVPVPAKPSMAPSTPVEVQALGGAERRGAEAVEGAWKVATRSNRGTRAAMPTSPAAVEAAMPATRGRDKAPAVARDAATANRAAYGKPGEDRQKWAVVKKGRQHMYSEPAEEEDTHTDATASTGPGGEEVTSGASTSGKEPGSRSASAQPPQVSKSDESEVGADGEAEDAPAISEDGWTCVSTQKRGKRDRKDPAVEPMPDAPVSPSVAGAALLDKVPPSSPPRRPLKLRNAGQARDGTIAPGAAAKSAAQRRGREDKDKDSGVNGDVADTEVSTTASTPVATADETSVVSHSQNPVKEAPAPPGSRTMLRYKVGIKQEEDFNLMRRLLVPGGGHIKRIAQISGAKLTVRGQGSGLSDASARSEADEPIAVCIWSAYTSSLEKAKYEVVELLGQLQEEYRTHCRRLKLPAPTLKIPPGEASKW